MLTTSFSTSFSTLDRQRGVGGFTPAPCVPRSPSFFIASFRRCCFSRPSRISLLAQSHPRGLGSRCSQEAAPSVPERLEWINHGSVRYREDALFRAIFVELGRLAGKSTCEVRMNALHLQRRGTANTSGYSLMP